jgi:formylglycine-generating enzyme required for sulfatase activity
VTNAEFACFIRAGGYQDERYWQSELDRRWLNGEDAAGRLVKAWLDFWQYLQDTPNWKKQFKQSGNYSPKQIEIYDYVASLSQDKLKTALSKQLSQKFHTQPNLWDDIQYNNPSQPVVSITWFEARAYCTWLTQITGCEYRLPSEVEWEAAARGQDARAYPWGKEWNVAKANTLEGRILKSSPVGVYAAVGGVGPFGAEDQSGNIWNWTSSLYLPYPYNLIKSEQNDSEGARVERGGSWLDSRGAARCATRNWGAPGNFFYDVGFRVLSSSTSPDSS